MAKVVLLFSGGLDSFLALNLLKKLNYEVIVVFIKTPFVKINEKILEEAKKIADELIIYEAKEEYLEIVKNPKFGYGKQMNPCTDCKIFFYKVAEKIRKEKNADFIATGEILGQRATQNLKKFELIEKEANVERNVVRILSGKLLPKTLAEEKGLIRREEMLDLKGRSRKKQLELVKQLSLEIYPKPSAGCLLTDPSFANRLRDLMKHKKDFDLVDIELLKIGRHFRINNSKLILGRNEEENRKLEELGKKYVILKPESKGPIGVLDGNDLEIALKILASYCKDEIVKIRINDKIFEVKREDKEVFRKFLI